MEERATRFVEEDLVPTLELDVHAGVVNAFLWGEKGVTPPGLRWGCRQWWHGDISNP
ncbi:hypothetical protein DFH08DRAFT_960433 [Mycena albidolilacea]|uniref:Uncharacterized protein n=1 Tax=Mycena albidolilacea TaxID=1033008 RepID=A0AAD7ETE9_9AGAR|nr:hypothetical protein DFH08DRAFT_960433 [Mycena albidolilacea]